MLNNKDTATISLRRLGLTPDESKIYLALLGSPMSHLEIARKTGVNRTKVYRLADSLIKRGLITEELSDAGRELAANDPLNLEIVITTEEERLKSQKAVLKQTLPFLRHAFETGNKINDDDFIVNTYEGIDGFKQMLWNELKTKEEILIFGSGTIQNLIASNRWAEKHREKTLDAGYKIREILNPDGKPSDFTKNIEFLATSYHRRFVDPKILPLGHQLCIYNNTVAIYNWKNDQKVGTEIINKQFADMQRAIFDQYWSLAHEDER